MGLLAPEEVERLYRDRVLVNRDGAYVRRYDGFDFAARFGDELGRLEFPRLVAVLEFERLIAERRIEAGEVLMVNGGPEGDPELAHLPHRATCAVDYDADPDRHDLHRLDLGDGRFDFVLFSQTLEHLQDPAQAVRRVFALTRPGGWAWTSVPTVSRQHDLPFHFATGLTPIGLACLFAQAGFDVVEVGQWGSRKYVELTFGVEVFPGHDDLLPLRVGRRGAARALRRARHVSPASLLADGRRNDFDRPVQAWILARRPEAA